MLRGSCPMIATCPPENPGGPVACCPWNPGEALHSASHLLVSVGVEAA